PFRPRAAGRGVAAVHCAHPSADECVWGRSSGVPRDREANWSGKGDWTCFRNGRAIPMGLGTRNRRSAGSSPVTDLFFLVELDLVSVGGNRRASRPALVVFRAAAGENGAGVFAIGRC